MFVLSYCGYKIEAAPLNSTVTLTIARAPVNFSIGFADGLTMKVNLADSNSAPISKGVRIRRIPEDEAKLLIECEDKSTIALGLADPANSVSVHGKNNQVEYLA